MYQIDGKGNYGTAAEALAAYAPGDMVWFDGHRINPTELRDAVVEEAKTPPSERPVDNYDPNVVSDGD